MIPGITNQTCITLANARQNGQVAIQVQRCTCAVFFYTVFTQIVHSFYTGAIVHVYKRPNSELPKLLHNNKKFEH